MAFNNLAESNKIVFDKRTTYYGNPNTVSKQAEVAKQFKPSLLTNTGTTVNLPKRPKDHKIVNTGFDKVHKQGCMKWSESTPLTYSCIVGWTTKANNTRKGRTVVDIRLLNRITLPDTYPMPPQANIFAAIQRATHMVTIDCPKSFHQSKVKPEQKNTFRAIKYLEPS